MDTLVESEHERFSGFLEVSLEELIVALRDDRDLLSDPEGLCSVRPPSGLPVNERRARASLYQTGLSAERFVEVVEGERVWAEF